MHAIVQTLALRMTWFARLACVTIASALLVQPSTVWGQSDFPSKPIRLIVPFTAGGGNDTIARLVAQKLGERWGQQVVVENRGGAGGNIGAEAAVHAPADGYTLFLLNSANLIAPSLYPRLGYEPSRDFAPVSLMVTSPFLILVPKSSPLHTVRELIEDAKRRPGALTFASGGSGSATHLSAEHFAQMAGIKLLHIPYKGAAPALVDLLAGRVSLYWTSVLPAMQYISGGQARALAVTGPHRLSILPNMPTAEESGLPHYEAWVSYGIVVPAGTSSEIIEKLSSAVRDVLNQPDTHAWLQSQGLDVVASGPSEYAKEIANEMTMWKQIVEVSGAKVD